METYCNIVEKCETPGTKLHAAWAHLPAPALAKNYWCLPDDASWVATLKHMLADEAHHRDVNHTFASLPPHADNPFVHEHMADFDRRALRRSQELRNGGSSSSSGSSSSGNQQPQGATAAAAEAVEVKW